MTTKSASLGSKIRKAGYVKGLIASLDLGGTNIKSALVDRSGKIIVRQHRSTEADLGSRQVVNRLIEAVHDLCSAAGISKATLLGVGVGCAGPLNPSEGIVYHSPNLPGWSQVPLRDWMQESLKLPVAIENDANAWALGEFVFGAGRNTNNMVCLTLGTGVGGGIVADGRLIHGARGLAAELGHMTINTRGARCSCGNRGCLEVYASARGICRAMRRRLRKGVRTKVRAMMADNPKGLTSKIVAQAARQGDKPAQEALAEAGRYLGVGLANIANIFNPEMIVIGGAVAGAGRFLIEPARDESRRRAFPGTTKNLRIVRGKLGEDAALLGAAAPFMGDIS